MPKKERSELVAGVFVIGAVVTLLGVVLWLGAADVFRPSKSKAVFYLAESAGSVGLEVGSFVKVNDDAVGQIKKIRYVPADRRTLYFAKLERANLEVYADGKARVSTGLVGIASLVISDRGSKDAGPADENNPVEISGGLDRVMENIAAAAADIPKITATSGLKWTAVEKVPYSQSSPSPSSTSGP